MLLQFYLLRTKVVLSVLIYSTSQLLPSPINNPNKTGDGSASYFSRLATMALTYACQSANLLICQSANLPWWRWFPIRQYAYRLYPLINLQSFNISMNFSLSSLSSSICCWLIPLSIMWYIPVELSCLARLGIIPHLWFVLCCRLIVHLGQDTEPSPVLPIAINLYTVAAVNNYWK